MSQRNDVKVQRRGVFERLPSRPGQETGYNPHPVKRYSIQISALVRGFSWKVWSAPTNTTTNDERNEYRPPRGHSLVS
jgi:hypothetical protein